MTKNVKVESVKIQHIPDDSPDTSEFGEFTDNWDEWNICRCCGEYLANCSDGHNYDHSREYKYFKPVAGDEKPGTESYQKYGKQDYDRMESLNNGNWYYLGVQVEAEVSYDIGQGSKRLERFTSGGLWGIESDCGDYIKEVEQEQLADLKEHLKQFGITIPNNIEVQEATF